MTRICHIYLEKTLGKVKTIVWLADQDQQILILDCWINELSIIYTKTKVTVFPENDQYRNTN